MKPSIWLFLSVLMISTLACTVTMPSGGETAQTPPTVVSTPQELAADFMPSAAPTPIRSAVVTAFRSVNIREEATEHSKDVGDLWSGDRVAVLGCFDGWVKIEDNQFVNARYIGNICE